MGIKYKGVYKMKRFLSLALTLLLLLSLAACGANDAGDGSGSGTPDVPASGGNSSAGRTDVIYGLTSDIGSLDHISATDQISNIT